MMDDGAKIQVAEALPPALTARTPRGYHPCPSRPVNLGQDLFSANPGGGGRSEPKSGSSLSSAIPIE
jgi:hypothetical protein